MKVTIEIDRNVNKDRVKGMLEMLDEHKDRVDLAKKKSELIKEMTDEFIREVSGMIFENLSQFGIYMFDNQIRLPEIPNDCTNPTILRVTLATQSWGINDNLEVTKYPKIILKTNSSFDISINFEDFNEDVLITKINNTIEYNDGYKNVLINHLKK